MAAVAWCRCRKDTGFFGRRSVATGYHIVVKPKRMRTVAALAIPVSVSPFIRLADDDCFRPADVTIRLCQPYDVVLGRPMDDLPSQDYRTDVHEGLRWLASGENVASTTSTGAMTAAGESIVPWFGSDE